MTRPSIFRTAAAALAAAAVVATLPALAARRSGSIALAEPAPGSVLAGQTTIGWTWRTGRFVRSTSSLDAGISRDGETWLPIASGVSIRNGEVAWDTTTAEDGVYALRLAVVGTTVAATAAGIVVDNTAPTIEIERPAQGDVLVEDHQAATVTVVAGRTTLIARALDPQSGVRTVTWLLDGREIATGAVASYTFGREPGRRVLGAVATDAAGNSAEDSIEVLVLPGPSTLTEALPTPEPLPSPTPPVPIPTPTETPPVPVPTPTETPPVPIPTPTETPPVPVPSPPAVPPPALPTAIPTP